MTTKLTLLSEPDSMLAKMFSGELAPGAKDEHGAYMIDGTPEYFKPILNYLRRRELVIDPMISKDGVLAEARYFGIQSLVDQIEKIPGAKVEHKLEEKFQKLKDTFEKAIEFAREKKQSGQISHQQFLVLYYKAKRFIDDFKV